MSGLYVVIAVLHSMVSSVIASVSDHASWAALGHGLQALAAATVGGLVSSAWQGAVLAACVLFCLRMFPGLSAAARSVVWMCVFAALVLLHGLPVFAGQAAAGGLARPAALELSVRWSLGIAALWAALSLVRAVQLALSAVRLRGLSRRAVPLQIEPELAGLLTVKLGGLVRRAELCVSEEVERPSVLGFVHPRILLPPALLERLTAAELKQVVLHEMEHLKRADDWTNLAQKLALAVFPLNVALLWVEHRLCAERELACDDRVLKSSCGRKAYAICLTRLAEYTMLRRGLSLALGAWERQSELVRRVHRILRKPAEQMSARSTMALTGGLMAGVLACTAGLAHSPQLVGFEAPAEHVQVAQAETSVDGDVYQRDGLRAVDLKAQAGDLSRATSTGVGLNGARMVNLLARQPVRASGLSAVRRITQTPPSLQQQLVEQAFARQALAEQVMARQALAQATEADQATAQQSMVVMTTWSADAVSQRVVFTVSHDRMNSVPTTEGDARPQAGVQDAMPAPGPAEPAAKAGQGKRAANAVQAVPATAKYAAVPFANGWLLVRI